MLFKPLQLQSIYEKAGRWFTIAVLGWGLSFSIILAADGSIGWRIGSAALILIIAVGLVLLAAYKRKAGTGVGIIAGIAGVAVGIDFGIFYLLKDGVSWLPVVGIIELFAAVTLLALWMWFGRVLLLPSYLP